MPKLFSPLAVKQNTVTHSGTGTFPLAPAIVAGFRRFGDAVNDNDEFVYYAKAQGIDEWEVGNGRFDATGDGLVERLIAYAGSNGANKVFFTSGIIEVSLVPPHFSQNYVATAKLLAGTPPAYADLPETNENSTVAIGKRANAAIGSRAIAIGDDSQGASDCVAVGTGAQSDTTDAVLLGNRCSAKVSGGLSPFYVAGMGIKATPYARGMHSFSAGGSVSHDVSRLYIQTTNATPDLMEMDFDGGPSGQFLSPNVDGRDKSVSFEVHLLARNATDNDAWYEKLNLVGVSNAGTMTQVGSTIAQEIGKGASFAGATVSAAINSNRLEITVTGVAAKTIQWAAVVQSTTVWHAGVPGSGVV